MSMNYTNEQLARIYGAYLGCECQVMQDNAEQTWYQKALLTGIKELTMVEVQHIYAIYAEEEPNDYEYNECQLLLTPLPEITDEHGREIAKMYGGERLHVSKDGFAQVIQGTGLKEYFLFTRPDILPSKLTDFLRSKGYDCGYGEIPSLIDAGIAIKQTTNK